MTLLMPIAHDGRLADAHGTWDGCWLLDPLASTSQPASIAAALAVIEVVASEHGGRTHRALARSVLREVNGPIDAVDALASRFGADARELARALVDDLRGAVFGDVRPQLTRWEAAAPWWNCDPDAPLADPETNARGLAACPPVPDLMALFATRACRTYSAWLAQRYPDEAARLVRAGRGPSASGAESAQWLDPSVEVVPARWARTLCKVVWFAVVEPGFAERPLAFAPWHVAVRLPVVGRGVLLEGRRVRSRAYASDSPLGALPDEDLLAPFGGPPRLARRRWWTDPDVEALVDLADVEATFAALTTLASQVLVRWAFQAVAQNHAAQRPDPLVTTIPGTLADWARELQIGDADGGGRKLLRETVTALRHLSMPWIDAQGGRCVSPLIVKVRVQPHAGRRRHGAVALTWSEMLLPGAERLPPRRHPERMLVPMIDIPPELRNLPERLQTAAAIVDLVCMTELRRGAADVATNGGATFDWAHIWALAGVTSRASQKLIQSVLAPRWMSLGDARWTLNARTHQERQALENVEVAGRRQLAGQQAARAPRKPATR